MKENKIDFIAHELELRKKTFTELLITAGKSYLKYADNIHMFLTRLSEIVEEETGGAHFIRDVDMYIGDGAIFIKFDHYPDEIYESGYNVMYWQNIFDTRKIEAEEEEKVKGKSDKYVRFDTLLNDVFREIMFKYSIIIVPSNIYFTYEESERIIRRLKEMK